MKKLAWCMFLMVAVVILLPFFIVSSSGSKKDMKKPDEKHEETVISVYVCQLDRVAEFSLEEYVKGVVAAEMPAEFEIEALKAQAVAARTYAYARLKGLYVKKDGTHEDATICTDSAHCQGWVSRDEVIGKSGGLAGRENWSRIEKAVDETEGIVIVYEGNIANPVFHSNSGGKTENAEDVWAGGSVPYLRSVVSEGEQACPEYKYTVSVKVDDFCRTLKNEFPAIKLNKDNIQDDIKIIDYTEGERVKTLRIGNVQLKGTEFRKMFSLRSAKFTIEKNGKDTLEITTIGNGHGVGMSQWGANYLAKNGATYEEILKYYYRGIGLAKIKDFEKAK